MLTRDAAVLFAPRVAGTASEKHKTRLSLRLSRSAVIPLLRTHFFSFESGDFGVA